MISAGQQIGRYQICSAIGTGGMGEVFLAIDRQLNRKVALKVLSEDFSADTERLRRFEQEAQAASALNHPNILTIFEFGTDNGIQYLATEFIKGETLRERLQRNHLSIPEILDITIQIASALQSAHSAQIVHRDIKPENIMIREDGYVKILDFGLAKLVENAVFDEDSETFIHVHTIAGMIMGTVGYMSPEQARAKGVDERTDLFSLGVVLYEMLTGRQPFTGETINHKIVAIIEKDPPPFSEFITDFPTEIEQITLKCLAKNPLDRYQTAAELLADLKNIKQEVDFRSKLSGGIAANSQTRAKTEILDADTVKTLNIKTDPNNDASTHKNSTVVMTGKVRSEFRFRRAFSIFAVFTTIAFFAYLFLPVFRPTPPKNEAAVLFNNGIEALREGTYYKASKLFEDAVKIDRDFAAAHAGLAESWMELDYFGRAQREMLKVNELQSKTRTLFSNFYKTEESLYIDAVNAAILRNFPAAIENYQKIVEMHPDRAHVFLDLGRAYEKNEETDKAIEHYQKAVELNGQYGAAFLRLGILYRRKALYDKSAEAFDKAEMLYDRLSNDEGVAEVKYQRGVSLNVQEKLADARSQFEQVIKNPRANMYQQIRALMEISSVCSSSGETPCAEEYASRAVELAKQERMENLASNGLINLGNAFLARADYDKAERNFLQAIEFSRKDEGLYHEARAVLAMGSLRIQQKKPDEAENFVQQALPFFQHGGYKKEIAQAELIRGRAALMKNNHEAALRAFAEVSNSPDASAADRAYAEMAAGTALLIQENFPAALGRFRQSQNLYNSLDNPFYTAFSLIYLAETLCQLGRFVEAREEVLKIREIIQKSPSFETYLSPRVRLLNAQIALRERRFAEAIIEAKEAVKFTDPSVVFEAHRILGTALSLANPGSEESLEHCRKALEQALAAQDLRLINSAKLTIAEALLNTGKSPEALENALAAKEFFSSAGQNESVWRAGMTAALASRKNGDRENARILAANALEALSRLQNQWGNDNFNTYISRPDIDLLYKEARNFEQT